MADNDAALVVLVTVPDAATGEKLARGLVEARLAACVNIVPGVTSVYRWQGKIETDDENLLVIKTGGDKLVALQDFVVHQHPYELPEVIALEITDGLPAYLDWMNKETR